MSNTLWIFVDKTTGKEMECEDLRFLLHQIQERGMIVPSNIDVDLLLRGRVECSIKDGEGRTHEIVIGEHSPQRGIHFNVKQYLN